MFLWCYAGWKAKPMSNLYDVQCLSYSVSWFIWSILIITKLNEINRNTRHYYSIWLILSLHQLYSVFVHIDLYKISMDPIICTHNLSNVNSLNLRISMTLSWHTDYHLYIFCILYTYNKQIRQSLQRRNHINVTVSNILNICFISIDYILI